jgi:tetratricopeptide (TPR) repeat protein
LDAADLQKRFAEVEVLVRRAIAGELDAVQEAIQAAREEALLGKRASYEVKTSANHQYFTLRIPVRDLATYDQIQERMIELLRSGISEKLVESIDELIQKCPTVPSLHYFRGLYYRQLLDSDEILKSYQEALRLFPEYYEARIGLGEVYLMDSQFDQGLEEVEKAIRIRPDTAAAYALRAMLRFAQNLEWTEAIREDLELAYALDPGDERTVEFRRAIQTEARGPRGVGCIYEYQSVHYLVVTDISEAAAQQYAERLEAAFAYYREYVGDLYKDQFRKPPRVAVFNTREAYYTYNELISTQRVEQSLGIFRRDYDELVLFEEAEIDRSLVTLYHEAFHHFMSLITDRRIPYWFNEGMADYIGALTIENGKVVTKGRVLSDESTLLRQTLSTGYFQPFEQIMNEAPAEFYSGWVGFKYSQAWSMLHFFHHAQGGKYRDLVDRYFRLLVSGQGRREAYDAVFKGKEADLEKEWKEYATKLKS